MPTTDLTKRPAAYRAWAAKNKERRAAYMLQWQRDHKEHLSEYHRKRRADKRAAAQEAKIAARKAKFAKADADYGVLAEASKMTANAVECTDAT